MSIGYAPTVSPWARALVPLADRVTIAALMREIGGSYYLLAASPRGPLSVQAVGPEGNFILRLTGDAEIVLPKAIAALRAWLDAGDVLL